MKARSLHIAMLCIALPPLSAAVGAVVAGRLQRSGMGWDEIASALGGLMMGGVAGLIIAIWLARRLSDRALVRTSYPALLMAIGLVLFVTLRVQSAMRAAREEARREAERLSRNQVNTAVQRPP